MPGVPVSLGSASLNSSATTTVIMTASASAAIGDLVIVTVGDDGGANIPSGVVDSVGNTYTADEAGQRLSNNYTRRRFSSVLTAAIVSGSTTITGTVNGGGGTWDKYITAAKSTPTGAWDSSRVDKTASATGSSTIPDSGLTATTTVAAELVYGDMCAGGAPTATSSGPLSTATNGNTKLHNVNGSFVDYATVYQVVAATSTYKASGTWQSTDAWACCVVTYKEASGTTQVSNEWALAYDILNQTSREWAVTYDIVNQVSREWALAYDILNQASREWQLAYDIINQTSREWALAYDIGGVVNREWALAYDILNQTSREWALAYDILNQTSREWALTYDIINQIANEWVLSYTLGDVAQNNLPRLWVM